MPAIEFVVLCIIAAIAFAFVVYDSKEWWNK